MSTPLFDFLSRTKDKLVANPAAILLIIAVLLTLFYLVPVYLILITTSIVISIGVGLLTNFTLNQFFSHIPFTETERGIIGGFVSGTTGFLIGTYLGSKLRDNIYWGYTYQNQQASMKALMAKVL